jgi:hypothetical protein
VTSGRIGWFNALAFIFDASMLRQIDRAGDERHANFPETLT